LRLRQHPPAGGARPVVGLSDLGLTGHDGYNSHPRVGRWNSLRPRASRGSAVVVMEPAENRDHRDAALELGRTRNRLLLRESLMRTRLVVEAHELGDEASEMVLAEEEDVVEQLPAQGAREPFGERV